METVSSTDGKGLSASSSSTALSDTSATALQCPSLLPFDQQPPTAWINDIDFDTAPYDVDAFLQYLDSLTPAIETVAPANDVFGGQRNTADAMPDYTRPSTTVVAVSTVENGVQTERTRRAAATTQTPIPNQLYLPADITLELLVQLLHTSPELSARELTLQLSRRRDRSIPNEQMAIVELVLQGMALAERLRFVRHRRR